MNSFYTNISLQRDKIVHRYIDKKGNPQIAVETPVYSLYYPDKAGAYKSIYGEPLSELTFDSAFTMKQHYFNVDGMYGIDDPVAQFISNKYPGNVSFDFRKIKILNIDIETNVGDEFPDPLKAIEEINSITVSFIGSNETKTWTTLPVTEKPDIVKCKNELEMLEEFLVFVANEKPNTITGWNVIQFDLFYIVNRLKQYKLPVKYLSPIHEFCTTAVQMKENRLGNMELKIEGVSLIDYIDAFKKFTYTNPPDYKLETVAQMILGAGKTNYSEYSSIKEFYLNDPDKFIEYNKRDVLIVNEIEQALNLLQLAYIMQYEAKCNTVDVFGTVKYWDLFIYNFLKQRDIQIPPHTKPQEMELEGAFVSDPILTKQEWVVSFDLTSLYPKCIQQYNISPETYVPGDSMPRHTGMLESMVNLDETTDEYTHRHFNGYSMAANGTVYTKDKEGVFSQVVGLLFNKRVEYKNALKEKKKEREKLKHNNQDITTISHEIATLDAQQMAMKIAINSLYGAVGNAGFRYFEPRMAEAITQSGQLAIKYITKCVAEYLDEKFKTNKGFERWIYTDTDSMYFNLSDLLTISKCPKGKEADYLDKFCKLKLEPFIAECYDKLAEYMNAYRSEMKMKREVIATAGIWRAKKNYILEVLDNEGVRYDKPELKMMGVETARKTTPPFVKKALMDCYRIMLSNSTTEKDLIDYVSKFKTEYLNTDYDELATPRGISDLHKWILPDGNYKKGMPYHCKASAEYNRLLKKHNLTTLQPITNGAKIRLILLYANQIVQGNWIAYLDKLPDEFGLHKFIDKETLFNKTFLSPLQSFSNLLNWKTEHIYSTDDFFD